jgi:hypothetical protein
MMMDVDNTVAPIAEHRSLLLARKGSAVAADAGLDGSCEREDTERADALREAREVLG